MTLHITTTGAVRCLYTEAIDLASIGSMDIRRASHVEPAPEGSGWLADLSPLNGPVLGPFLLRSQALAAEVAWIERHVFGAHA